MHVQLPESNELLKTLKEAVDKIGKNQKIIQVLIYV
eukprot:SAG11_NODE_338_length_10535_cov_8.199885_7_plen_36_part_00